MENILEYAWAGLWALVYTYLLVNAGYLLVFAVAGKLGRIPAPDRTLPAAGPWQRFLVLMPSYKEDAVILRTAADALQQQYPADRFEVVVIADSLRPDTVQQLRTLPLTVLEVQFENSTKARSINAALDRLPTNYNAVVVLDADNLMAPDFLARINAYLNAGYRAVQGHRVAKNQETPMAYLDAMSEEINNHLFRRGHRVLGLSAALIGSGAAIAYEIFRDVMRRNQAVGGFDKELEFHLLGERIGVAYAEEAYVYDEKVSSAEVFGRQRRRWLAAQWHYARQYTLPGFRQLLAGNRDYFDKACQTLLFPRVLLLGVTGLLAALSLVLPAGWIPPGMPYWLALLGTVVLVLLLSIPGRFYSRKLLSAILPLPKAFGIMLWQLFRLKGANRRFIHTPHHH